MNKPDWKLKDQYYTRKEIAKHCYDIAIKKLEEFTGRSADDVWFIEPAAGEGSFYNLMPKKRRIGYDIEPKCPGVINADFLKTEIPDRDKIYWTIGNPPYGFRLKSAREFFNRCASFSEAVCFICPITFCRFQNANRLLKSHRIIYQEVLSPKSFYTPDGKSYNLPTELSIWVKTNRVPPIKDFPRTHPDLTAKSPRIKSFCEIIRKGDYDLMIQEKFLTNKKNPITYKKDVDISKAEKYFRNVLVCINDEKRKKEIIKNIENINWVEASKGRVLSGISAIDVIKQYTKHYGDGSYLIEQPKISHPHFEMITTRMKDKRQKNRKKKISEYNFDFNLAFEKIHFKKDKSMITDPSLINQTIDHILVKCSPDVKKRLMDIDWDDVLKNEVIKNIEKATIVKTYTDIYGDGITQPTCPAHQLEL